MRRLGEAEFLPLKARIGIHVGDVMVWDNTPDDIASGAKPFEVEGLVKPIAARLMQLALPGQILLSGVAQCAGRALAGRAATASTHLVWHEHGRYRFKGVPEPVTVFEVGERDIAPLERAAADGQGVSRSAVLAPPAPRGHRSCRADRHARRGRLVFLAAQPRCDRVRASATGSSSAIS